MNFIRLSLLILSIHAFAFAQNTPQPEFANDPLYWKNRKPTSDYWQQDVAYKIDAKIDEVSNIISASQTMDYWNNSPDTLQFLYFHLFQNAFVKGSYLHELETANKVKPRLGNYEAAGLGTTISSIENEGVPVKAELDNTVLKVHLDQPILPGGYTQINMKYATYFDQGGTRRRMKMYDAWGFKHYNGVQWFPKICVYDAKFGWDTDQHLNKEFYGEFGSYDVRLEFASNYIVEATGELVNREEVLPKDLRARLDMKLFKDKKWNEPPSTIIPYNRNERKTWHFKAKHVHDFAFTADPSYRIATTYWNGIECVGIAQEPHASGWQNSANLVAKIVQTFSEDFGQYIYPKMIAADAADGMEYPMLTLDGGRSPSYNGLLIHEIGHNWFYGMVGSNETYRAAMDEGFTQFLTAWGTEKIDGRYGVKSFPKNKFKRHYHEFKTAREARVILPYVRMALAKHEVPLNTHSNDFGGALGHENGYGLVYYKTATMLYNLQYVLGEELFQEAMKNYFEQWKLAHPYFEDFKRSIIGYTKVDLNWFFDQFFETTKTLDYAVKKIKKTDHENYAITFKRKGDLQMPIDFEVKDKKGVKHYFHIPNTWFVKETNREILPRWYGFSKTNQNYTAHVNIPNGLKTVTIDTSGRLPDINGMNNTRNKFGWFNHNNFVWKPNLFNYPLDRYRYRFSSRIDPWWNPIDGLKIGVHFEGHYMQKLHRVQGTVWWNTHLLQDSKYKESTAENRYDRYVPFNYTFKYETPLNYLTNPDFTISVSSRFLDGLWKHNAGFHWKASGRDDFSLMATTQWRSIDYDLDYLLFPNEWSSRRTHTNSFLQAQYRRQCKYFTGNGQWNFTLRAPFMSGQKSNSFNYAFAQMENINRYHFGKFDLNTRVFFRYGMGQNLPFESSLFLSGANPEVMMENKYTRSKGFYPNHWSGYSQNDFGHIQKGGGLNLRGYAGYLVSEVRNGQLYIGYKGRSGAAINVELEFDKLIKWRPRLFRNWLHIDAYAFGDAGTIELSQVNDLNNYWQTTPSGKWSQLRVDAGLGLALTVKRWWIFDTADPLTVRFDLPLFVNRPPAANPEYLGFRYVIGVSRAF